MQKCTLITAIIGLLLWVSTPAMATRIVHLTGGSNQTKGMDNAAQYGIELQHISKSGLGFYIGSYARQSAINNTDVTITSLPSVGLLQYININKMPLKLFFGGGFDVNNIPSSMGSRYIGTQLRGGILYYMSAHHVFTVSYTQHYGKTKNNGAPAVFDGNTIQLGIGFMLPKPKQLQRRKPNPKKAPLTRRKRPHAKQPPQMPSNYKQTQNLMKELSWPTY
jgi:hypothetical protein